MQHLAYSCMLGPVVEVAWRKFKGRVEERGRIPPCLPQAQSEAKFISVQTSHLKSFICPLTPQIINVYVSPLKNLNSHSLVSMKQGFWNASISLFSNSSRYNGHLQSCASPSQIMEQVAQRLSFLRTSYQQSCSWHCFETLCAFVWVLNQGTFSASLFGYFIFPLSLTNPGSMI